MAYYKHPFKHRLIIRESRVFEALSAMISLSFEHHEHALLSLDGITEMKTSLSHHPDYLWVMTFLNTHQDFLFGWMEFALVTDEREDVNAYFNAIETLSLTQQWFYFLGSKIDPSTLEPCKKSPDLLLNVLIEHDVKNAQELYLSLFHFDVFLQRFKKLALLIDQCPAFDDTLKKQQASRIYQQTHQLFEKNMTDRHPLSYAQELMSKPFWNIADYDTYEFIILYYLSPYRLRLFNEHRMIYVHSLIRLSSQRDDLHDTLAEQHKLLSDASRIKILKMLYMKPMYGKQIADAMGLTTATVSHHLDVLRQHGFINMEQEKQIKYFSTNISKLKTLNQDTLQYILSEPL